MKRLFYLFFLLTICITCNAQSVFSNIPKFSRTPNGPKCETCSGLGYHVVGIYKGQNCKACNGTGNANGTGKSRCDRCKGTGRNPYGECSTCKGQGFKMLEGQSRQGQSSYDDGDDDKEVLINCRECKGTGRCRASGTVDRRTTRCDGTGECPMCNGEKILDNPYGGSPIKCTACNGSGKCKHCGGSGECPRCNGSGKE